ncbi:MULTISPECIES: DUF3134 domain-containing protein [Nostoc]|uniref:DUF3134 domain-containing protein n=1 Tax=Nostoc paludosum FACHB-159 TaxID=2692908 RepID=A0ABR8K775_9NOSO|nr:MULTISPECIES: DUF3134 domain-containing protein [Nostoc]MBD2678964.1 DUF3134 domain-containing protein [Nostoc sp. FACHB-857]MBD2735343.1 DUF3134 domain-containing protein [Nostoc paludosum FACHB-159]
MLNSPLREEPRNQRADVIPLKQESSLLDWLQTNGRLIARDVHEPDFQDDEEEIDSLMGVEDGIGDYDLDDDDDIGIAED